MPPCALLVSRLVGASLEILLFTAFIKQRMVDLYVLLKNVVHFQGNGRKQTYRVLWNLGVNGIILVSRKLDGEIEKFLVTNAHKACQFFPFVIKPFQVD